MIIRKSKRPNSMGLRCVSSYGEWIAGPLPAPASPELYERLAVIEAFGDRRLMRRMFRARPPRQRWLLLPLGGRHA
jgi:hypothetical protein